MVELQDQPATIAAEGWTCPLPLRDSPTIVMGHGGGGAMSAELVDHLFLPAFADVRPDEAELGDAAVLPVDTGRVAMSTDSFVVRPLFFPGGSIGDLAVNGTVNDLAMSGAVPRYLSVGFILEEGTDLSVVGRVAQDMGRAAARAGVRIVTGDTKVVDAGHGDQVYVNTAGVGTVRDGIQLGPSRAETGDVVLVSGDIGVHGIAIMSVREGLEFGTTIETDSAPLHDLVGTLLEAAPGVHALRDPTRGGLATSVNEIAAASGVGVAIDEHAVPVPEPVANACAFLGLDPWYVANEGKLVAFVPPDQADAALEAMRGHPLGQGAAVVGHCVAGPSGHGRGPDRVRRHPRGRRPHRRAAPPDLLRSAMKFLVLWTIDLGLLSQAVARAIARMPAYGEHLEQQGKVLMRYHIVGAHGGAWIYDVGSHEEFERLLAMSPVFNVAHYTVHPLADMREAAP